MEEKWLQTFNHLEMIPAPKKQKPVRPRVPPWEPVSRTPLGGAEMKKKLRRLMVDPIRFPMNSIRKKKEHLSTKDSWAEQPKTWEREDF